MALTRYSASFAADKARRFRHLMMVGGWIELVGGFLDRVWFATRLAAFIASGEMAVAYFMMHAPKVL